LTLLDMEVQQYILHLHEISGSVNGAVVRKGIPKRKIKETSGSEEGATQLMPVEIRFPEDWDVTYTSNHWSN